MARVTNTEVLEIIELTELETSTIDKFIESASMLVDDLDESWSELSDARLSEIELYLAAHFCSLREPRLASEGIDVLSARYQGKTGMYLEATHYGQMAMMFDSTGTLRRWNTHGGDGKAFVEAF